MPLLFDVSAQYGFPCRSFLPEYNVITTGKMDAIKDIVNMSDVIAFGGGADIATKIYNHRPVPASQAYEPSYRDRFEIEVYLSAVAQEKPMLGICRGAQLLCALNGGSLIQDVDGHGINHAIETLDKEEGLVITSTHHQMMNPIGIPTSKLLAWTKPRSKNYLRDLEKAPAILDVDPEVIWVQKTRSFCIQGHPEYMTQKNNKTVQWLRKQMFAHFNGEFE